MAATLTTLQTVSFQVTAVDRKGNPAKIDAGTVEYSSSDESVFTVKEDPTDETKGTIVPVGPGVAQLDFSGDADLDLDETKTITGFAAVEVQVEEAAGFGITFGEPVDNA